MKPITHIYTPDGLTLCGKNGRSFVALRNAHILYGDRAIRPCELCKRVHGSADRRRAAAVFASTAGN